MSVITRFIVKDEMIDALIQPPRRVFEGFDWSRTDKLKPQGKAEHDRLLAERFRAQPEEPR